MADYTLTLGPDTFPNAGENVTGDDFINGLAGNDNISAGAGNDTVSGGDGIDTLFGQAGDDSLFGGQESDNLNGGDGDDYLDVGVIPGADVVNGGAGTDTVAIDYSNVVFVDGSDSGKPIKVVLTFGLNFVTQIEGFVSVQANNVEKLVFRGPEGVDTIQGGALNDIIIGNGGADTLRGGGGDDYLQVDLRVAGADKDNIFGDAGNDTLGLLMEVGVAKDTDVWVVNAGSAPTRNGVAVANVTSVEAFNVYIGKGKTAQVTGGAFDDSASVFTQEAATFDMGGGNDKVVSTTQGAHLLTIDGGAGDDDLTGHAQQGTIRGGSGNDTIKSGITQKVLLDGGDGDDVIAPGSGFLFSFTNFNDKIIDGGSGFDTVSASLAAGGFTFRNVEKLTWTLNVEIRIAQIAAFTTIGGADSGPFVSIVGEGGTVDFNSRFAEPDVLSVRSYASKQNANKTGFVSDAVTFIGRALNDQLFGAEGVGDTLIGNGGDDIIGGDYPSDFGATKPGDDVMTGGAGADTIDGGPGQDTANYSGARASYAITRLADGKIQIVDSRGGSPDGTDNLTKVEFAKFSDATILLAAAVAIAGSSGADTRTGTAGDDLFQGLGGTDTLNGGDGEDTLDGGAGADTLNGGNGLDIADASAATGVVYVDLQTAPTQMNDGMGSVDTLSSIEGANGGSGDDGLIGNASANEFRGHGGTDVLRGGGGDDFLDGGSGERDYLMGGASFDPGENGTGADTANGGDGVDVIYTQDGNDTVFGGAEADFVLAGNGNDTVDGGGGDDFLFAGSDYVIDMANAGADILRGGYGVDFIVGGQGNDALFGDAGNDILYGGSGADLLEGGTGDDSMVAGAGDDTLAGGAGANYLFGEGGSDTYVVRPGDGATIAFGAASDEHFRFQGFAGITSFAQLQPFLSAYGGGTQFFGPGSEYVIFENAVLTAANTGFVI